MESAGRTEKLYRERILEHAGAPHNWSPPASPLDRVDRHYRELNPLCGDDLTVTLAMEPGELAVGDDALALKGDALAVGRDGRVAELRFEGHACAICQAAASMASDQVRGRLISEIIALDRSFILELLGTEIPPLRLRCALLPLKVLKSAALGRPADWP